MSSNHLRLVAVETSSCSRRSRFARFFLGWRRPVILDPGSLSAHLQRDLDVDRQDAAAENARRYLRMLRHTW